MVRKLRVQYPGAVYHVMSRGDRREDSFEDDRDVSMGQRVGRTYSLNIWSRQCLMDDPDAPTTDGDRRRCSIRPRQCFPAGASSRNLVPDPDRRRKLARRSESQ